ADLERLFEELRHELVPLATALTQAKKKPNVGVLRRDYPVDRQRGFCTMAAGTLGFDLPAGPLDNTTPPLFRTTPPRPRPLALGPGDRRLRARSAPSSFGAGFCATLREGGHGLSDQGPDPAHRGTPLGEAASLAVHESQARLWENPVGRRHPFWKHFLPRARQ